MAPTPQQRAEELLARMTLEEKAQQLTGVMPFGLISIDGPTAEQLSALSDGIGHVSMLSSFGHLTPIELARTVNRIQRYLVENTRLGIPALFHLEALNGLVAPGFTTFPTALGLAATWNPSGVEQMARILARQMRAIGYSQALSPVMDVARDPRWGRVHESYGEDPQLVSEFSVAYTKGLQGADLSTGAIATGKHFLGFGVTDGGQHMAATSVHGRELREVYARPFEASIREAGLASMMNSYSTIDGIPVGANKEILTDLLRDQLGFSGTVVSDYGTIANLYDRQGIARDLKDAGRMALEAGLDVELPQGKSYGSTLVEAVREGIIDEALVDRSVLRALHDKFAVGLFDAPFVDEDPDALSSTAHDGAELALQLARESITLLRNDGTLPLEKTTRRIAIIGPHAETVDVAFPGYTYYSSLAMMAGAFSGESINMAGAEDATNAVPPAVGEALGVQLGSALAGGLDEYARSRYGAVSLADAVRQLAPDAEVLTVTGCGVLDDEATDFEAAAAAAAQADVVVLALGGRPGWFGTRLTEGEGSDRANIDLPSVQVELARAVTGTGTPTVGVVFTGRPFALAELDAIVPTLLYPYYGGQSAMVALAEVLFGDTVPSGKLPLTLPRHSGQIPMHSGQHRGSGYRRTAADAHKSYTDMPSTPLYPFGHGLSYTTFEYSDVTSDDTTLPCAGDATVRVRVTNTGDVPGTEIVQIYASHRAELVSRPEQELVAFARVDLEPGQTKEVRTTFSTGQLAYLGADNTFIFDPGPIDIRVGSSSEDIRAHLRLEAVGARADWTGGRPLLPTTTVAPV